MPADRRALVAVAAALLVCAGLAAQQEQTASAGIGDLVEQTQVKEKLPALAVVVVRSDGGARVYVSGERRVGKGERIEMADRMHLGSLSKAITATVIGALAEKRRMTFETTIGQAFPELSAKVQVAYRDVTVRQLLTHTAGVASCRVARSCRRRLHERGRRSGPA